MGHCAISNFTDKPSQLHQDYCKTVMMQKKRNRYNTFYVSALPFKTDVIRFWMTERSENIGQHDNRGIGQFHPDFEVVHTHHYRIMKGILTGHCAIGNFAANPSQTYQNYYRNYHNLTSMWDSSSVLEWQKFRRSGHMENIAIAELASFIRSLR